MLHRRILFPALGIIGFMILMGVVAATAQESNDRPAAEGAATLSTAFTYQGRLTDDTGDPVDGTCTFTFELYDAATGASPLGTVNTSTTVANGFFTARLDFGESAFDGNDRYLDVAVDCGDGETAFAERQPLTPAPYVHYAASAPWDGITDMPTGIADGDDDTTYSAGFGLSLTGAQFDVMTDTIQQRVDDGCDPGQAIRSIAADGTVTCEAGAGYSAGTGLILSDDVFSLDTGYTDGRYWALGGNGGIDPAVDTLGTTDGMTLTLIVSGTAALRIAPATDHLGHYSPNLVAGLAANDVTGTNVAGATVAGGGSSSYPNHVTAGYGTVSGGYGNVASGVSAAVGGGTINTAGDDDTTVSGGGHNSADGHAATVGGGWNNSAANDYATVSGGTDNTATGGGSTVGGGSNNVASEQDATVGGGENNSASGGGATVSGGADNTAGGGLATVGGGRGNMANEILATVGGGRDNVASGSEATVGGGRDNVASGPEATVGGGSGNTAGGSFATVPGGWSNTASGGHSFAAGSRAQAVHEGAFVWGDSTDADIYSGSENVFVVRANGGVWFGRATAEFTPTIGSGVFISTSTGAHLTDGGAWTNASDRAGKEAFEAVDGRDVLLRLVELPIETWNYQAEDPAVRHMGPVAQEFYAAFGLGGDETSISTVDADGVALAAIQGLYEVVVEKEGRIAALEAETVAQEERIDALQRQKDDLEERVEAIERLIGESAAQEQRGPGGLSLPDPGWIVAGLLFGWVIWRRRPEGGSL